jgi:hypothetical protein
MLFEKQRLSVSVLFVISAAAHPALANGTGPHPSSSGSAPAIRRAYGAPFSGLSVLAPGGSHANGRSERLPPPRIGTLPDCGSQCRHQHLVPSRSERTTCAVLSGVAATGVGIGALLFFTTEQGPDRRALAPSFRFRLSTNNAVVSARWSF